MKKAFSLMELMVVIIILGLLTTLVLPNLLGKSEQAKQKLVCIQMKTIAESVKMFRMDFGNFPTMDEGLKALIANPDPNKYKKYPNGGYLDVKSPPKDSWGNEFIYIPSGGDFDLVSLGADGREGGTDENTDIYFSKCEE
ncbi:MAG: type II secretion system major pseudopilin GspG [Campylobacteraceae bacterium]|nr:type II secretion system major pseudopilin GspG [Campylobacteraceae bacterium]